MAQGPAPERTSKELRAQAAQYRFLASTADTIEVEEHLRALAARLDTMADDLNEQREG